MKIDVTKKLTDLKGEVLKNGEDEIVLGLVMTNSLLNESNGDSGEVKMNKFQLSMRINKATGNVELSAEEAALIKSCVAKSYATLIMGQVWQVLDGK